MRQRFGFAQRRIRFEREIHVTGGVAIRAGDGLFGSRTGSNIPARERVAKSLHRTGCSGWH
jgi:hypothetical protein